MFKMNNKVSTCLYIDRETLEAAKRIGLNVSRVSENALKEAINLLNGPKQGTGLVGQARLEGRGRDLNPGARLHRPIGYQATSPRPLSIDFGYLFTHFRVYLRFLKNSRLSFLQTY